MFVTDSGHRVHIFRIPMHYSGGVIMLKQQYDCVTGLDLKIRTTCMSHSRLDYLAVLLLNAVDVLTIIM